MTVSYSARERGWDRGRASADQSAPEFGAPVDKSCCLMSRASCRVQRSGPCITCPPLSWSMAAASSESIMGQSELGSLSLPSWLSAHWFRACRATARYESHNYDSHVRRSGITSRLLGGWDGCGSGASCDPSRGRRRRRASTGRRSTARPTATSSTGTAPFLRTTRVRNVSENIKT